MKLLSIVIPVFNVENYIDECIRSIVNQNDSNYEVILVDDGSSDNSLKLCKQWSEKNNRINIFRNPKRGVSSARNYGISKSNGDYIIFLDSDDRLTSNALKIFRKYIEESYDFIMGTYNSIYIDSNIIIHHNSIPFDGMIEEFIFNIDTYLNLSLLQGPCWKAFKASIINENKLIFPENISYGEDAFFVYNYLQKCKKVKITVDVLYEYTIRKKSLSHGFRPDKLNINFMLNRKVFELKKIFNIDGTLEKTLADRDALLDFWKDIGLLNKRKAIPILRNLNNRNDIKKLILKSSSGDSIIRKLLFFLAKHNLNIILYCILLINRKRN